MTSSDVDLPSLFNNWTNDRCFTYIPERHEYYGALGWIWIVFICLSVPTTLLLYAFFIIHLNHIIHFAHHVFRNSLIWISSIYPFMALMTTVGFLIPRSQAICYAVKVWYMFLGISKFADLTILMYGSEEVMLWTIHKSVLKLAVGPVCCCCRFLPNLSVTKRRFWFLIAGVHQLPFTQAFYLVTLTILQSANEVIIGSLDPKGSYLWLNLFSILTSLWGVYSLNILSTVSHDHLQRYSYNKLSFVMKMLIIVTKLQDLIFSIMAYYKVFPCVLPYISYYVYRESVENAFYIFEMAVFGSYSYLSYGGLSFDASNPSVIRVDANGKARPHHQFYLPTLSADRTSGDVEEFGAFGAYLEEDEEPKEAEREDEKEAQDETRTLVEGGRETYDFSGSVLVIGKERRRVDEGYERLE